MRTKKNFSGFVGVFGYLLRILMVLTMLFSTISTQFTSVNAATIENSRVKSDRMLKETRLDDEGGGDMTSQGDEQENPTEEPPEEPPEEPTVTPTEDSGQEPTETPAETPTGEPSEEPTLEPTAAPECYVLTLDREGEGSDLLAQPLNSIGCIEGSYLEGEVISLTGAVPGDGWEITGWSGTADDTSMADSNLLIMPAADHTASVIYNEITMKALSDEGEVSAQTTYDWVAYNDCVYASGQHQGTNVTSITLSESGTLIDQATGSSTGVTAEITSGGSGVATETYGGDTDTGTDAYITFFDYVDLTGDIRYGSSTGWYVDVTFTDLDSSKTYTFATTANRNNSGYDERDSLFTISGIDDATNESTEGTITMDTTTVLCTGYNYDDGYVARWTGIQPGADGEFSIRVESNSSSDRKAYGPSVFMLAEEAGTTTPTINTTSSMTVFSAQPGSPSEAQTYTVSGSNLLENININAPTGFELSTDDSSYYSTLALTQTDGVVGETTIYVRLASSAEEGTFSGNIEHSSSGAATQNVEVSGSVLYVYTLTVDINGYGSVTLDPAGGSYNNGTTVTLIPAADSGHEFSTWSGADAGDIVDTSGVYTIVVDGNKAVTANFIVSTCTSVSLEATADTFLRQSRSTYNYGGSTEIYISPYSNSGRNALFLWDLSSVPSTAIISTASLSFYVTDDSDYDFDLYAMRQSWVEGTSNDSASSTSANWDTYDGSNSWGSGGAESTTADRYDTDLWDATSDDFDDSGDVTIDLNSSGLAVIGDWLNGSVPNNGLTVQFTGSSSSNDYWIVASTENTSSYTVPTLNITYCESTSPTIMVSAELTAFSAQPGSPSDAQTYTVEGSNLTDDISINAPEGFELSTDGSSYYSTLTLTQSGGSVGPTTVYVRLASSAEEGTFSGNIEHSSSGAVTQNVEVSGTVNYPTIVVTGTLDAFSSEAGSASDEQSYTVAGNFLIDDITISAPADFYISTTSGSGFGPTLTLTPTNGAVAETPIYVYFLKSSVGTSAGNITHTSSSATEVDLAVSGIALEEAPWIAYNDCSWGSGQPDTNITTFNCYDGDDGELIKYYDGTNTGITVTITSSGLTNQASDSYSSEADPGTDAYETFYGIASILWGAKFNSGTSGYVDLVFSGLDVNKTYTFASTANRNNSSYTSRLTTYQLIDAITATNESTEGVDVTTTDFTDDTSTFCTGYNTVNGYVARWTGIQPSTSGTFTIKATSSTQASIPAVFLLAEEASITPTITTTSSMTAFSTQPGSPSDAQNYTVEGSNLTDDISINAPGGFELSIDGSNYYATLTLTQSGGSVDPTTIYVRLASSTVEGTFSGNITHDSTGAATKNVAVNGAVLYVYTLIVGNDGNGSVTLDPEGGSYSNGTTVTLIPVPNSGFIFSSWSGTDAGDVIDTGGVYTIVVDGDKALDANFTSGQICTTVNLPTSADTWLRSSQSTMNYGATTTLQVSNFTTYPQGTLMKWDLSEIPLTATVTGVSLTLNVTDKTTYEFCLYDMLRDWVEGTNDGAAGTGASWTYYDAGSNEWGEAGAQDTTTDRNNTNLWSAGVISTTGSQTFDLNSSGISIVQGWVADDTSNHGLTIQNYSGTTSADYLKFDSREGTSAPTLNVTYCVGGTVTHTLAMSDDGNGSVTLDPAGPTYDHNTVVTLIPVPSEGYEFSAWSGINASDPNDNGDGSWSLTMDGDKSITANFSLLPVNVAPDQPVLVQPEDAASGILTSPTLEVTVSDANLTDTLDVNFYGRAANGSPGEDFTLIAIPDSQNDVTHYPEVFTTQMQWIADNDDSDNIVFTTHLGDIVNSSSSTTEWTRADTSMQVLDTNNVPYSVGPGNHDVGTYSLYSNYFGSARFAGMSTYQGYYTGGNDNYNNYSFFSASGMDFIVINLQYNADTNMQNWADTLLKDNPDRRGIVVQHNILNINNSWYNQSTFNSLKDNPNLFLMLCGHMHSSTDGAAYREEQGDDGHTIHVMLADYQDFPASGYLRILRFSPENDKIYATTYSPYTGESLTSTTNYDQMEMVYDMANGGSTDFELIGSVEDVANGSNASITWDDLANSTEYEWYVTVSDDTETVTGSTWSFTTESAGTNHAPVLDSIADQEVDETNLLSFTATADDVDSDPLAFSLDNGTSGEVPAGAAIGSSSGVFSWTPSEAQGAGYYTFDVCVSDGSLSDCQTIHVTVNEVNNAPELASIGAQGVDELVTLSFTAVAVDGDEDPVTYSLADGTGGLVPSGAAIGLTSGAFTWTPTEAQGPDSYTFDVCASDSVFSDCETITATVNEVNAAPVLAFISDKNVVEENELTFTASATDEDVPANTLAYALTGTVPAGASINASNGVFSWTPDSTQGGSDYTFTVEVCDDGDPSLCGDQEITVTVEDNNVAPEAFDDSYETNEDTQLVVSSALGVLANDEDDDEDELNAIKESDPQHGSLIFNTDGSFTYTPTGDYNGSDSFTYKANDGALDSNIATVNLNIISMNDDPVITEGDSTDVGMSKNGLPTAFELTLHASDVDTSDTLTWSIAAQATHGTASASGTGTSQVVGYTPETDYVGDDSFVVEVSDDHEGTDSITVNVHISEVVYTISGNAGAGGTTLTYTGGSTVAESNGDYTISVPYDWSGTVTPSLSGYLFTPESRTYSNVVADISGEDYTAVPIESQDVVLVEGWNLVSFRIAPTSTLIEDVLASIAGNYSLVYAWDASVEENSWKKFDPNGEVYANTLFNLDERMGFWINMTAADTLTVTGTLPSSTNIALLDDAGGWNLVGYPSETSGTLPEILVDHGVGMNFSLIYAYEANDLADPWKMFDRLGSGYANDLTSLASGYGHWIKVSGDLTWNVPY